MNTKRTLAAGKLCLLFVMLLGPSRTLWAQKPGDALSRVGTVAQVVSGGGWSTQITLINLSASVVTGRVAFYSDDGSPLTLPLVLPLSNSRTTNSVLALSIGPNETFVIESGDATASMAGGWADIQASDILGGFAILRLTQTGGPDSETSASLFTRQAPSLVLPYDNTTRSQTAIALVNGEVIGSTISVIIRDHKGEQLASSQITVPSMGHTSFFTANRFPQSANRQGIIELRSNAGTVAGMALRFGPALTFTVLPTIP